MAIVSRSYRDQNDNTPRPVGGAERGSEEALKSVANWVVSDKPFQDLLPLVKKLATRQQNRLMANIKYMSLYSNRDFMSDFSEGAALDVNMPRMSDNQIKTQCDTTVGKIVQSNSRVTLMANGGNWSLWNRARKIENALKGEWDRMRFYSHSQRVCTDGFVTGTGYNKFYISDAGDRVCCERVFPNEVFVDEQEAAYGNPTRIYQMRYVTIDKLAALYPEKWEIIRRAPKAMPPSFPWIQYANNSIEVVEAWSLPIGDQPGRHCLSIASGDLIEPEEYDDHCLPFVWFSPADAPFGFYGCGWVEQTMAAQILLNKMLNIMEQGAHYGIAPFWSIAEGQNINVRHLDNVVGHVVETSGGAASWVTNAPFHEAAPVYCQMLRKVISDFFGNNEMDTGSGVPINRIDSKKALREFTDISASRITTVLERWSKDYFLNCAERTLMLAQRIAKTKGGYPVLVSDSYRKSVQLDWKDLDMERDAYLLTPAPANLMSNTPSARLDDIKELLDSGLITQKMGQKAMQSAGDIDALINESTATETDLDWVIEQITEHGNYVPPSTIQDLSRGLVRMSDAYLQYRTLDLPTERLEMFARWLMEAQDRMTEMQAQHQPDEADPLASMQAGPPGMSGDAQSVLPMTPSGTGGMPLALPPAAPGAPNGGIPSSPGANPTTGPIPIPG